MEIRIPIPEIITSVPQGTPLSEAFSSETRRNSRRTEQKMDASPTSIPKNTVIAIMRIMPNSVMS